MGEFFSNVARYPKYLISIIIGGLVALLEPFFKKRWVDAGFVLLSLRVFRLASVHEKKNRLWMLEIFLIAFERIQDCTGISLLRSMIVTVNSYHPLNQ